MYTRMICLASICLSFGMRPLSAKDYLYYVMHPKEAYNDSINYLRSSDNSMIHPPLPTPETKLELKDPVLTQSVASASLPSCELFGAHAIADWLNSIYIGKFIDSSGPSIRGNQESFVMFNSSQNIAVWLEPYRYKARWKSSKQVNLSLSTIGTGIGARYSLSEQFQLGAGAGYFHSNFKCKNDKAKINGFYLGPSMEYIHTWGTVGLSLFGIGNFYDGQRKIKPSSTKCKGENYNDISWDVDLRLAAEYDLRSAYDYPDFITIHPNLRIDYLNVFEKKQHSKINETQSFKVKGSHSSFIHTKLGVRLEKAIYSSKSVFMNANFDLGWVNMTALSKDSYVWKPNAAEGELKLHKSPSKNQASLAFDILGIHHTGLLIGLGYQTVLGASSPIHIGRARIEWNW